MADTLTITNNNGVLRIECTIPAQGWYIFLTDGVPTSATGGSLNFSGMNISLSNNSVLIGRDQCPIMLARKRNTILDIFFMPCSGMPPVGGALRSGNSVSIVGLDSISLLQSKPVSMSMHNPQSDNIYLTSGNIKDLYNIAIFNSFPFLDGKVYNFMSNNQGRIARITGYADVNIISNGVSTHVEGITKNGDSINQDISGTELSGEYNNLTVNITPPEIYFAESPTTKNILHVPMTESQGQVITGESDRVTIPDSALLEVAKATPPPEITVKYTGTSVPTVTDTPATRSRKKVK